MAACAAPAHGFAFEQDVALLAVFQQVAAAQKSGLARPGRPDQRNHVAFLRGQADPFQHLQRPIGLVQVADLDNGRVGHVTLLGSNLPAISA